MFEYGGEGDQDVDGYKAKLSNGNYDYILTCVLKSERKTNRDEQLVKDGIKYTVSLNRCDLENIQTGETENIGYISVESWIVRDNESTQTKNEAIYNGLQSDSKQPVFPSAQGGGSISGGASVISI